MICFSPAKINLGLYITEKRPDGFHNIETVFYPIQWADVIEIHEAKDIDAMVLKSFTMDAAGKHRYAFTGIPIPGALEDNLLCKAMTLLEQQHELPPLTISLHKSVPMGAGLGGGSSNAATLLKQLNIQFQLQIGAEKLQELAARLGSDCAFFVKNRPCYGSGKGDILTEIDLNLSSYYLLVVYPGIHSNTAQAYAGIKPKPTKIKLSQTLSSPIPCWKTQVQNDFETGLFARMPELEQIKNQLYEHGALYASLSGSGSALFGIFDTIPNLTFPNHYRIFVQEPIN